MKTTLRNFMFLAVICAATFCQGVSHTPFVIITPEKTGTHLLTKAVTKMTGKPVHSLWLHNLTKLDLEYALMLTESEGEILHVHNYPSFQVMHVLQEYGYKVLYLERDPRDQLVSALLFVRNDNWSYETFDRHLPFGMLSFDDQLSEMITGERYGVSMVKEITVNFMPWRYQPQDFVCTLRYEDLVGSNAGKGASNEKQLFELQKIRDFLDMDRTNEEISIIAPQIYGSPGEKTFRQGKIGRWKKYFKKQHIQEYKELFGDMLIELDYEKDLDW